MTCGSTPAELARLALTARIEDGDPFANTVYVEQLRDGRWVDLGYFDGDQNDPDPVDELGDAYRATVHKVAEL